ncbi:MAG: methyl-accepting chemotaxis protein [Azoarcus sp.]|nr:methyl-accepting chemotaxis protein [Azoarcus sp.]
MAARLSTKGAEVFDRPIAAAGDERSGSGRHPAHAVHEASVAGERPTAEEAAGGAITFVAFVAIAAILGALGVAALAFLVYAMGARPHRPDGKAANPPPDGPRRRMPSVEPGGDAAAAAADALPAILQESLRAVRSGLRDIDRGAETLANNVQQIAADQTNLFALQNAVETMCTCEGRGGFAAISSEIRALAGRSSQLSDETRNMADQLRTLVKDTAAWLERLPGPIESRRIEARNAQADGQETREQGERIVRLPSVFACAPPEQDATASRAAGDRAADGPAERPRE